MADEESEAPGQAARQRKKRGSSGLPKGVTASGKRFQARINWYPGVGQRRELRGLGSFDTVEEAAAAVAAAAKQLAAGQSPWNEPKLERQHKRGEVRPLLSQPDACVGPTHMCDCVAGSVA